MVCSRLEHTLPFKSWFLTIGIPTYLKGVCPFIAYCVTEFETVFCSLICIFWRFLPIPPLASNKHKDCFSCDIAQIIFLDDMNNLTACITILGTNKTYTVYVLSEDSNQLGHQSIQSDLPSMES